MEQRAHRDLSSDGARFWWQLKSEADMGEGKTRRLAPPAVIEEPAWEHHHGDVYRCVVFINPEANGGFRAVPARLPEAAATGATEQEALDAAVTAVEAAFRSRTNGTPPWTQLAPEPPPAALVRSVNIKL